MADLKVAKRTHKLTANPKRTLKGHTKYTQRTHQRTHRRTQKTAHKKTTKGDTQKAHKGHTKDKQKGHTRGPLKGHKSYLPIQRGLSKGTQTTSKEDREATDKSKEDTHIPLVMRVSPQGH